MDRLPLDAKLLVLQALGVDPSDDSTAQGHSPMPVVFQPTGVLDAGLLITQDDLTELLGTGIMVKSNVLPLETAEQLRNALHTRSGLCSAKLLGGLERSTIRGDAMEWLSVAEEGPGPVQDMLVRLQALREGLDRVGLGSSGMQVQCARYAPGTGYARHLDGGARRLTLLYYANGPWDPAQGGALRVFVPGQPYRDIPPTGNTLVMFLSQWVPHQVCTTRLPRMSLTLWLY